MLVTKKPFCPLSHHQVGTPLCLRDTDAQTGSSEFGSGRGLRALRPAALRWGPQDAPAGLGWQLATPLGEAPSTQDTAATSAHFPIDWLPGVEAAGQLPVSPPAP